MPLGEGMIWEDGTHLLFVYQQEDGKVIGGKVVFYEAGHCMGQVGQEDINVGASEVWLSVRVGVVVNDVIVSGFRVGSEGDSVSIVRVVVPNLMFGV